LALGMEILGSIPSQHIERQPNPTIKRDALPSIGKNQVRLPHRSSMLLTEGHHGEGAYRPGRWVRPN
jgi:hypothetical protein